MSKRPYPYQKRVAEALLRGQSVILQAPTGAGKTLAALWPFLHAQREEVSTPFPAQCIYSVPMRVLATQFFRDYSEIADSFRRRFTQPLDVRIQTGEIPTDPELTGDLIFATLDQTLSSLLGVPYSLSRRRANLNVGAVLGSYLVFDEFHLFPHEAAQTTLQLLQTVGRIAPFILMTATFSKTMLEEIGALLGAVVITVPDDEVRDIETRQGKVLRKERRYHVATAPLNVDAVLASHERRTLAVCNTVDRATILFDELIGRGCTSIPFEAWIPPEDFERLRHLTDQGKRQAHLRSLIERLQEHLFARPDENWVMLLHGRFERPHRQVKEELLQALWNPENLATGKVPRLIVVGTQVVEVGLDISAQVLHTEIAPAASVLQRAGRCARSPGEQGTVYLYPVPENKRGEPNYAPYGTSKIEKALCERSWEAFWERDGQVLHFAEEQEIINEAHTEADRALLQGMQEDKGRIWGRVADALTGHDASTRRDLIRKNIEGRTVIVYDASSGVTEENPFAYEGFSLHIGTLRGKLENLLELKEKHDLDWALRSVTSRQDVRDPEVPPAYQWLDIDNSDALEGTLLLAVNPRLVTYDAERGFRLGEASDGGYCSKKIAIRRQRPDYGGYRLESYDHHIARMRQVFERGPWQRRLQWIAYRLAQQEGNWHVPEGSLERAVRLAFALHDVGKLDVRWQAWAHAYQQEIGEPCPDVFMIAHTHYEQGNETHENAQKRASKRHPKPKTHAGEGADAGARILFEALDGRSYRYLYRAAYSAIARHHSPMLDSANGYALPPYAKNALAKALNAVGEPSWEAWSAKVKIKSKGKPELRNRLLPSPSEAGYLWWWVYFVIVRNLRLCDGASQEE